MIRAFYGIDANPIHPDGIELLNHQQEVFDIIKVHSHRGGLCLLMGEPGTGKTSIKNAINRNAEKTTIVVNIARTLQRSTKTSEAASPIRLY